MNLLRNFFVLIALSISAGNLLAASVTEQSQLAAVAGEQLFRAAGDIAQAVKDQAVASGDKELAKAFDEGSVGKVFLHAAAGFIQAKLGGTGASGILASTLGATTNEALLPELIAFVKSQGYTEGTEDYKAALKLGSLLVGTVTGAATGGSQGANAAGNTALDATTNNYLKHADVDYLAKKLAQCKPTDNACKSAVVAEAKERSDANDAAMLACGNNQTCVQGHIGAFVQGAQAFDKLFEADANETKFLIEKFADNKKTFGAMSDMQAQGGLLAANLSAGNANLAQWQSSNCVALTTDACTAKFQQAAANGDFLNKPRESGSLQSLIPFIASGGDPHEYKHNGTVCSGSDSECTKAAVFTALRMNAGPGNSGTPVVSGGVSEIKLLNTATIGYVTHLVDPSSGSVVNITLPGQHALDQGWVVRQIVPGSSGAMNVNTYGAGTGANRLNFNSGTASMIWGGNLNFGIRPIFPSNTSRDILCQKFLDCK